MPFRISSSVSPDQLNRVGPLIPGSWMNPAAGPNGTRIDGLFVIDTGAGGILIDEDVAATLKIASEGTKSIHGVGGNHNISRYTAQLLLPAIDATNQQVVFRVPVNCFGSVGLTAKHKEFGVNVIGLLGRMFLQFARLEINGVTGSVSLQIDDSIMFTRN